MSTDDTLRADFLARMTDSLHISTILKPEDGWGGCSAGEKYLEGAQE